MTWLRHHYADPLFWLVMVALAAVLVVWDRGWLAVVIFVSCSVALAGAAAGRAR